MKKVLKRICGWLLLVLPTILNAQGEKILAGIKWTENLSWDQVKEQAKKENKYIFIDAFATWCGPCKMMDKDVYTNDTVGNYFNEHFISVKVQMDKTKNDNESVQNWHKDVEEIRKQCRIKEFPSYIFFSPQGIIVHKDIGYKPVDKLIAVARVATTPGQVYNDPYAEYERLMDDYHKGIKHYDRMIYMINTAFENNDTATARTLNKDFRTYAVSLPKEKRYTRENIEFWNTFALKSTSEVFHFFYKDGDKINEVMNNKGYAERLVDRTITIELVDPFLGTSSQGWQLTTSKTPENLKEPDWKQLTKIIKKKHSVGIAGRIVLAARMDWYNRNKMTVKAAQVFNKRFKKYGKKYPLDNNIINQQAWNIFISSTDKMVLNIAVECMADLVRRTEIDPAWRVYYIDTYANLLYKIGRKEEALKWEEKAIEVAINLGPMAESTVKEYKQIIDKMKKGIPTWFDQ